MIKLTDEFLQTLTWTTGAPEELKPGMLVRHTLSVRNNRPNPTLIGHVNSRGGCCGCCGVINAGDVMAWVQLIEVAP
jgi:hypothetical protein